MSEKNSPNPEQWRLESEVANRNSKRGGGERGIEATDIVEEELAFTSEDRRSASNRTYEVSERIKTAEEIDKQRRILARIGMKIGVVNPTTEKDIAHDEALKENEKIDTENDRIKSEMEQIRENTEKGATERQAKERTRLLERNAEISQRMVDIDAEIRKLDEAEALCMKEGRNKFSWSGQEVVYSVNPDGTPNTDPDRRPQNSTGIVEDYRSRKAELRKEKESITEEFEENQKNIES